jgi:DNA polymerase-3 subunit gamma/tau
MSQFIVSARKYRPQRFEDVVGQQHVALTLKNALATDHVAHAFLFCGPRGVGKTTCARILAKILNCEQRTPQFEACNECSSCRAFNENASFNIIELDAASNNSVDHIRALVEQVRFQPQQGRYKVFIIDEVHMLSSSAFNAFLKTLEEPPPYAIFILATTEKHKIIPTILSRCQIFDFRRITVGDMVLHLKSICEKEGIAAEEDALHIVAQKADGALRDALSIFDRITSFSGKRITYNDVIENLNVLDYDYYFQITDALLAEDLPAVLNLFDQILRKGFEADVFVNGLAEHLRHILVCKDEATLALLEAGESLRERYRKQAALAPTSFLLTALNLANDCDINFKMARHKRLHVEIALIKMCHIRRAVQAATHPAPAPAPAGAEKKNNGDGTGAVSTPAGVAVPVHHEPLTAHHSRGNAQELDDEQMAELRTSLQRGLKKAESISLRLDAYEEAVEVEEAEKAALESRLDLQNAADEWRLYGEMIDSPSLRQAMNSAELRLEDKIIVASVGLALHRNTLLGESNRLLDTLRQRLHDPLIKIRIEVDDRRNPAAQPETARARPLTPQERLRQMQEGNPLVSDLIQRFGLKLDE